MSGGGTAPLDPEAVVSEIKRKAELCTRNISCFSDWVDSFTPIEDIVDKFVDDSLKTVPDKTAEELIAVIKDRRQRLPLSTGITDQIVGICKQILAFGAAGLAVTVGFADKITQFSLMTQKMLAVAGIFYAEMVLVSLLVLVWYLLQARFRYPSVYFKKIGNAWPFFYYASITPVARAPIQSRRQTFKSAVAYAIDLVRFAARSTQEGVQDRLRTELQQYFLLVSYQAYINQFSLRIANMFIYGFFGALLTAFILLAAVFGGLL